LLIVRYKCLKYCLSQRFEVFFLLQTFDKLFITNVWIIVHYECLNNCLLSMYEPFDAYVTPTSDTHVWNMVLMFDTTRYKYFKQTYHFQDESFAWKCFLLALNSRNEDLLRVLLDQLPVNRWTGNGSRVGKQIFFK
jgi:hypothetical protein